MAEQFESPMMLEPVTMPETPTPMPRYLGNFPFFRSQPETSLALSIASLKAARRYLEPIGRYIAGSDRIPLPNFKMIQAQLIGNFIQEPFKGKHGLGPAVTSQGTGK